MRNFRVTIAYDGSNFGGWQRQKNSYAVQQAVEDTLKKILKKRHTVTGCSRTDAGVHANRFVFNFHTESGIPCKGLYCALNAILPEDVAVLQVEEVDLTFSARFNAVAKEYIYKFQNTAARNPFNCRYALHVDEPLDEKLMNAAAKDYIGRHDFAAFRASGFQTLTSERTIYDARVERFGDEVVFTVTGDGFLYNMVRIMAGTLYYIAIGKLAPDSIPGILASLDREKAGKTLPPHGLYLNKIYYDNTHDYDKIWRPAPVALLTDGREHE
ncbi:MAG: tRNA pseudouridine(38-40) synthase TruA [Clostridia bacterium]|nr:tRNA pseudouridine(38-40) synthase TruA [Clostridia bacterium]